jgi:hypothetical protein
MASTLYVGLANSSNNATAASTATFTNVTVTGNVSGTSAMLGDTSLTYSRSADRTGDTAGPLPTNLPFDLRYALRNTGTAASQPMTLRLVLSQDSATIGDALDAVLVERQLPAIGAGQTYAVTLDALRLPPSLKAFGRAYFGATISVSGATVGEGDVINITTAPVTLYDPTPASAAVNFAPGRSGFLVATNWLRANGYLPATTPGLLNTWIKPIQSMPGRISAFDGSTRDGNSFVARATIASAGSTGAWTLTLAGDATAGVPLPGSGQDTQWNAYADDWARRF